MNSGVRQVHPKGALEWWGVSVWKDSFQEGLTVFNQDLKIDHNFSLKDDIKTIIKAIEEKCELEDNHKTYLLGLLTSCLLYTSDAADE